ncbi:MAG: glycosyltransferase family 2 protein [Candidatus Diapherotrites archaeon]|uniref:Glycosyltransferase family 2 protein n=1 Tax=Candidatus Iainarchaeum sp. TaxID=3101447 RepID=A0A7J4ISW9_9ARCH|nr:MAG: hypothetical protein QT03_C0001G0632 [archaeon GW2011_AR10]MBS3059163.1 glycosyltransferase family 2 protein [Candidatus Diapherotrites archaeon]HIH08613.1 glycosyltransferase family 2 protein [Candidatus Diapherotrites archaeon]
MEKPKKAFSGKNGERVLTVAVVNWNTRALLEQCLNSAYKKLNNIGFEVIVVDNGSTDGSIVLVKKKFPKAKLIANKENLGFGKAFNQAIHSSHAPFIAIVSSDIIFLDSLKPIVEFMQQNEKAAAVSCKLLNKDKSVQKNVHPFPSVSRELLLRIPFLGKRFAETKFNYDKLQEVDSFTGACYIVSGEAIEEVGGFDENYFVYVEETDWFYRMKKAGWKIFFSPDSRVIHLGGASSKTPDARYIMYYTNLNKFFRKHHGLLNLVLLKLVVLPSNIAELIVSVLLFNFSRAKLVLELIKINLLQW